MAGGSGIDPAVNARNRIRQFGGGPDRWVRANHPDVGAVFFDRKRDGVEDGGFVGFEELIDAAEVWSAEILNLNPAYNTRSGANRTFGWLQMLNQGRRVWCVAVTGSSVTVSVVGGPTCQARQIAQPKSTTRRSSATRRRAA